MYAALVVVDAVDRGMAMREISRHWMQLISPGRILADAKFEHDERGPTRSRGGSHSRSITIWQRRSQ